MSQQGSRLDAAVRWAQEQVHSLPQLPLDGYVYLMKSGDLYKIGMSRNPRKRLGALRTSSSSQVTLICTIYARRPLELEQHYHRLFQEKRRHGEWFELTDADVVLICRQGMMPDSALPCQWGVVRD